MHARQLAFQQRGVRVQQALDAAGAFRAGNRTDTRALLNQPVFADAALYQQKIAAVQRHIQRGLRRLAEQQVALAQVEQTVALGQGELQLQRDAAVGDVDLQGVAQRAHQLAAADGMGEIVLLVVLAMKQHQAAAIVERVQLGLVERRGLLQAVAITLQQFGQARPR